LPGRAKKLRKLEDKKTKRGEVKKWKKTREARVSKKVRVCKGREGGERKGRGSSFLMVLP